MSDYETSAHPIFVKWRAEGGEAKFGRPVGDLTALAAGGAYQIFDKTVICHSPQFGAVVLTREIFMRWQGMGAASPGRLGFPVGDYIQVGMGGVIAYFEQGLIGGYPGGAAYVAGALIAGRYRELQSSRTPLNVPLGDEEDLGGGVYRAPFTGGPLYFVGTAVHVYGYTDEGGTHAFVLSEGPIRARWESLGGHRGGLGCPISDTTTHDDLTASCRFQRGLIVSTPYGQTWEICDEILSCWESHGGSKSQLGYPVGAATNTPAAGGLYQEFDKGIIVYYADGPYAGAHDFTALDLFLGRFAIYDSGDEIGSSGLSMYVQAFIESKERPYRYPLGGAFRRFPESGTYGESHALDTSIRLTDRLRHDSWFRLLFQGMEWDGGSSDDFCGEVQGYYSIDNLWGLLDGPGHRGYGDSPAYLDAEYQLRRPPAPVPIEQFREHAFWPFHNFGDEVLSKQQYAATFADVDNEVGFNLNLFHDLHEGLEALYYELAYKRMAKDGNCFGMCVESVYSSMNRSLFALPLDATSVGEEGKPETPGLRNEINIKHGYQLGWETIRWYLANLLRGATHDPMQLFEESRSAFLRGEHPLFTLSQYFGQQGHVVRPWKWRKSTSPEGKERWFINVANPNSEWPNFKDDEAESSCIVIDPETNEFRLRLGEGRDAAWYIGSQWRGARLSYIPYSCYCTEPTTPCDAIALLTGGMILILGSARTQQLEDSDGKTFYNPGSAPLQWSDLCRDPEQRLANTTRIPLLGAAGAPTDVELHYHQGRNVTLRHAFSASGSERLYWGMGTAAFSMGIGLAPGPQSSHDVFTVEHGGTAKQTMQLDLAAGGGHRAAEIWLEGPQRPTNSKDRRIFGIHDLSLAPEHALRFQMNDGGNEIVIENRGPALTFKVSAASPHRSEVTVAAGEKILIKAAWESPERVLEVQPASSRLFALWLDSSRLSVGRQRLLPVTGWLESRSTQVVEVKAGHYALQPGMSTFPFEVTEDGTIDYATSLDGFVEGRGTAQLTVRGYPISIDSSALTVTRQRLPSVTDWMDTTAPQRLSLIPGQYDLQPGICTFTFEITGDGTIDYDATLDRMLEGRGTTTLVVHGHVIGIDLSDWPETVVWLASVTPVLDAAAAQKIRIIPGAYEVVVAGRAYPITVTQEGTIEYASDLDDRLAGRGTPILKIRPESGR